MVKIPKKILHFEPNGQLQILANARVFFRFIGAAKTANAAAFDSEARSQLMKRRVPFFGSRYAVSFAEIREAQSRTKQAPAAAQGSAGDPGIESGTHEGR